MSVALTGSGKPIICDGCRAPVEAVTEAMKHPVPREVALAVYGQEDLVYIVCAPLPDGSQPCLELAKLSDELYERVRCRVPGCDGTRCGDAGRAGGQ